MARKVVVALVLALLLIGVPASEAGRQTRRARAHKRAPPEFTVAGINDAQLKAPLKPGDAGSAVVRAQIMLDRAHFSPGEIAGLFDSNTQHAVAAFQTSRSLPASDEIDANTWQALNADTAQPLISYAIQRDDLNGPFAEKIPTDMHQKAKLDFLGYASPIEEIAERFHVVPSLLRKLNPGKTFKQLDEQLVVPNVLTPPPSQAASVVVDGNTSSVAALDSSGHLLAWYPASTGSEHVPLPPGQWKVTEVRRNPWFFYNPDLFWDANPKDAKAKIAPGPKNPVGVVWIGLSREHYGIHGGSEPGLIGRTQSHGCIRLTNWDADELANMVSAGTPVGIGAAAEKPKAAARKPRVKRRQHLGKVRSARFEVRTTEMLASGRVASLRCLWCPCCPFGPFGRMVHTPAGTTGPETAASGAADSRRWR